MFTDRDDKEELGRAWNWREDLKPSKNTLPDARVHIRALKEKLRKTMEIFVPLSWDENGVVWADVGKGIIPSNAYIHVGYKLINDNFYRSHVNRDDGELYLEAVMGFCGWLEAIYTEYAAGSLKGKLAFEAISATQSKNGFFSPRTKVDIFQVYTKFPSPGRFMCLLEGLRDQTNRLLRPYGGVKVMKSTMVLALMRSARISKARVIAAAMTLTRQRPIKPCYPGEHSYGSAPTYRQARDCLAGMSRTVMSTINITDGVPVNITAKPVEMHGCTVSTGWVVNPRRPWLRTTTFLVGRGRETFHIELWGEWSKQSSRRFIPDNGSMVRIVPYSYTTTCRNSTDAVRAAIRTWKDRRNVEKERQEDEALKKAYNEYIYNQHQKLVTVLCWFTDSRLAGNCAVGTRGWMEVNAIPEDRLFAPIERVLAGKSTGEYDRQQNASFMAFKKFYNREPIAAMF